MSLFNNKKSASSAEKILKTTVAKPIFETESEEIIKPIYKIIAIMGPSGVGKDTLVKEIRKVLPSLHEIISYTTRPQREGDIDGATYHFVTEEEFINKITNHEMVEATKFNDWFYGTAINSLSTEKVNIGVFNPAGVRMLMADQRVYLKIYRLCAPDKMRMLRSLNREENPDILEICRRYQTDAGLFADLSDIKCDILTNEEESDLIFCRDRIIHDAELMSYFKN